jgi:hypothetical protein
VIREAGKAFADGVEDTDIKIQLLLEGEKTVNEALRQTLELQAVFLAARPRKTSTRTFWGSHSPQPGEGTEDSRCAEAVGSQVASGVTVLTQWREKTRTDAIGDETTDTEMTNGS